LSSVNKRNRTTKLKTIALATAFAVSSFFASFYRAPTAELALRSRQSKTISSFGPGRFSLLWPITAVFIDAYPSVLEQAPARNI
jgi:hypothetical protein